MAAPTNQNEAISRILQTMRGIHALPAVTPNGTAVQPAAAASTDSPFTLPGNVYNIERSLREDYPKSRTDCLAMLEANFVPYTIDDAWNVCLSTTMSYQDKALHLGHIYQIMHQSRVTSHTNDLVQIQTETAQISDANLEFAPHSNDDFVIASHQHKELRPVILNYVGRASVINRRTMKYSNDVRGFFYGVLRMVFQTESKWAEFGGYTPNQENGLSDEFVANVLDYVLKCTKTRDGSKLNVTLAKMVILDRWTEAKRYDKKSSKRLVPYAQEVYDRIHNEEGRYGLPNKNYCGNDNVSPRSDTPNQNESYEHRVSPISAAPTTPNGSILCGSDNITSRTLAAEASIQVVDSRSISGTSSELHMTGPQTEVMIISENIVGTQQHTSALASTDEERERRFARSEAKYAHNRMQVQQRLAECAEMTTLSNQMEGIFDNDQVDQFGFNPNVSHLSNEDHSSSAHAVQQATGNAVTTSPSVIAASRPIVQPVGNVSGRPLSRNTYRFVTAEKTAAPTGGVIHHSNTTGRNPAQQSGQLGASNVERAERKRSGPPMPLPTSRPPPPTAHFRADAIPNAPRVGISQQQLHVSQMGTQSRLDTPPGVDANIANQQWQHSCQALARQFPLDKE